MTTTHAPQNLVTSISDTPVPSPTTSDNAPNYLRLRGLSKSFGDTPVFQNIDADIVQGEFVTLLGPSGCGKSTLLRAIAGLTDIDAGEIEVDGEIITRLPPQKRDIGMVFQHYALFPNMSVRDNVAFGLRMRRVAPRSRRERVEETLALVELGDHAHKYPHQLSGGQRQRVALARSLVTRPRILLMDEPLSALDAKIRQHLRDQIREIQQQLALTTLFVTHDQEEALMLSDRIFLMGQGRILQQSDAESLYTRPASAEVAEFVGAYNRLDARAARRLLGQHVDGRKLALRPEALYLMEENGQGYLPPNPGPACTGLIVKRQLLGNVIRYRVDCDGMTLNVDTLNRGRRFLRPEGSQVVVYADVDEARVL
ncbi:ABC transporter ATP-binding protein [Salinicola corii]|uniref:ABC transporter ATP-binding protein n=1 Tax=Salinicola corii TaxID=2606937 RepID=A0A640WIF5_9GAMM|nr:ABC transporter ATP-binding protein [Salinicola corii]KAA0020409.1 ABC transporter ATP-binding protein [Salinicola corii]